MCGRTVFTLGRTRVSRLAAVKNGAVAAERISRCRSFNLAPTKPLICVRESRTDGSREVDDMIWGIDPRFETDKHLNTINARVEGVSKSRMYSHLLDDNRCVVIVDAFYEWDQTKKEHTPYLIRYKDTVPERPIPSSTRTDQDEEYTPDDKEQESCLLPSGVSPLYLAAIYDTSRTTGQNKCSILTMDSSGSVAKIHCRMPVILSPETAQSWLSSNHFEDIVGETLKVSKEASQDLQCTEVSSLVNKVSNQSRDVTLPVKEMKKRSFEQGLGRFFSPSKKPKSV